MSNLFELPKEYVDEQRKVLSGAAVELPFPALHLWWHNGNRQLKVLGEVPFNGGWAADAEAYASLDVAPFGFTGPITLTNREGNDYTAFMARSVAVAVIARRKRWVVDREGKQGVNGKPKGRSQVQVLAYAAGLEDAGGGKGVRYIPWGPVVLSGKGFAGKSIEDALRTFERGTADARRLYANGYPFSFFYANIGTFGKEPNTQMVGSANQQSPITPCEVHVPDPVVEDHLKAWFVGGDIAAVMMTYKAQAREWLEEWEKPDQGDANGTPPAPDNFGGEVPF